MSRMNWETAGSSSRDDQNDFRDIHALTPLPPPPPPPISGRSWASGSSENFSSMSREFNALVLAGSNIEQEPNANLNLDRIGEDHEDQEEDSNPLAIVPDVNPVVATPATHDSRITTAAAAADMPGDHGVHRVIKEEVDAKITAWQTAKIAKINNRFKRQDAIISGWEKEQVNKASTCMKIVERKLEEKRAKAQEKMENEIAKAHRKAEERRATAEGKRGRKVAKVLQVANLMKAVGRPPAKRSFF